MVRKPRTLASVFRRYAKTADRVAATTKRYETRLKAQARADAYYQASVLVNLKKYKTTA